MAKGVQNHTLKRGNAQHPRSYMILVAALVAMSALVPAKPFAAEGKRVAFVVGIGAYDNLGTDKQLKNAVNDAEGVSKKLREIGFKVISTINPDRSEFNNKWYDALKQLGSEDTFILFYSGHGVQIRGQNFLLPRDVPPIRYDRREVLEEESIRLNKLLDDLSDQERPHPKYSVVILDACRDDPFVPPEYKKGLNVSRGLTRVESPRGTFVLYSAGNNSTALDRLDSNDSSKYSVFTRVLIPLMGRKDLSIQELTTELKEEVYKLAMRAHHEQVPAYYENILGRFCLPGCDGRSAQVTPPPASPRPAEPAVVPRQQEQPVQPVKIPTPSLSAVPSPAMVRVPNRSVLMYGVTEYERPLTEVNIAKAFAIAQYETSFDEYDRFAQATGRPLPDDKGMGRGARPVINVSWIDAKAYAQWLSQQTGKQYRLPSEAEWECAAKAEPFNPAKPFSFEQFAEARGRKPVDSKQPNGIGLYGMSGDISEWMEDCWHKDFRDAPTDGSAWLAANGGDCNRRVVRSGPMGHTTPELLRVSKRFMEATDTRSNTIGFRLVQDLP